MPPDHEASWSSYREVVPRGRNDPMHEQSFVMLNGSRA